MRTSLRRAVVAALALPVLVLSAGCSGGSDDGGPGGRESSTAHGGRDRPASGGPDGDPARDERPGTEERSESDGARDANAGGGGGRESGAPPLSREKLHRALVTEGDLPGYAVRPGPRDALPADATVAADRPECRPITDALDSRPKYPRTAYASVSLVKGDLTSERGGTLSQLLLAAYRAGDAQKWLAELRRAVATCRAFTAIDGTGDREPLAISPGENLGVGDASVSFLMRDKAGKDAPVAITVVRTGGNTATFMSAGTSGKPEPVARTVAYEQHRRIMDAGKVPR